MTYATSLHSQKSEASTRSARSYFSLASAPSIKSSLWRNLRAWITLRSRSSSSETSLSLAQDIESITTTLTSSSCSATTTTTAVATAEAEEADAAFSDLPAASSCLKPSRGILVKARRRQRVERVTFREPSPVPRFRNAPPPPPPSPPYLEILVRHDRPQQTSTIVDDTTVFVQKEKARLTADSLVSEDVLPITRRLSFTSPWHRGQTLFFTLFNALPEEHLIVFKFLTPNTKLSSSATSISSKRSSSIASMMTTTSAAAAAASQERYFVRPSTGTTVDQTEVMLFLNQVPEEQPPRNNNNNNNNNNNSTKILFRDKIIVRWAIVQRRTQVEAWVLSLPESMRRKWLEMLIERWADQVVVRETRLKIRFLQ
ncbi:hypothetical protein BX666DRAFT_1918396 [Dichotomocladium elegans]|nr:hypothetical protein BX666DRAFT_1918396 [Dichotomocladium elegans]